MKGGSRENTDSRKSEGGEGGEYSMENRRMQTLILGNVLGKTKL